VKWPLSNSDNGLHLSPVTSRPFLAVVQYDGARFAGWQRQPEARTVQAEFETVLERVLGGEQRVVTTGAGRTDTGVHALGQGVSFTPGERWEGQPSELRRALNALLPDDVWVEQVHAMRPGFDARRSAAARRYRYVIGTDEAGASPFRRPYEWALARPLDLGALRDAAALLAGEHDFRGLAAAGAATAHYRCRVALAEWAPRADVAGGGVTFTIEADRFLHHMVRFLVGAMVDIALGRRPPPDFPRLLAATDNLAASPPAPPQGLYLVTVRYPPELYAEACP
jgi:tRNA pseudouridine38-40 synthase